MDCLLCDWLAGRAFRNGVANDYWLMVADIAWKEPFLNMWDVPTLAWLPYHMQLA